MTDVSCHSVTAIDWPVDLLMRTSTCPPMAHFQYERLNPFCRMAGPQENAEMAIPTVFRLHGFSSTTWSMIFLEVSGPHFKLGDIEQSTRQIHNSLFMSIQVRE